MADAKVRREFLVVNDPSSTTTDRLLKRPPPDAASNELKKSKRGQNKTQDRPRKHVFDSIELCVSTSAGKECPRPQGSCRFTHDAKAYLAARDPAIPVEECPAYSAAGRCHLGLRCRMSATHTNPDTFEQLCDTEKEANYKPLRNLLSRNTHEILRKRALPLTKETKDCVALINSLRNSKNDIYEPRAVKSSRLDISGKTYLAPLTTVGNLPFRRLCKGYGVDITCGEMAHVHGLASGTFSEWALLKRHPCEDIFGVQIAGSKIDQFAAVCQLIKTECDSGVDFVDLNLGCPIDSVFGSGCGAALLDRTSKIREIVTTMSTLLPCPVTVKVRTGTTAGRNVAHKLIPIFGDLGVSMVTIHGRSRQQRYKALADWDYIEQCAAVKKTNTLVFGNGDVFDYTDYKTQIQRPGIDGIMIGRAALIKPWIFTEIKEQRVWDISSRERLDMMRKFVNYGLEHWGSDTRGINTTRRFLLEFQSFHHRYIPVGILDVLPQRLSARPPRYFGRDSLETLLASPYVGDWIRLSEMLLGPVPLGFDFIPKHRANAFEDNENSITPKIVL